MPGVNCFGNLAGVIGSQLFRSSYGPNYLASFYATLGFIAIAFAGYLCYHFTLKAVNAGRQAKLDGRTIEEIENERTSDMRYADKKYTFIYGL